LARLPLPIQNLKGLLAPDLLKISPIASHQYRPNVSDTKGDQGTEGQSSQLVLAIALFSTNDGKDFSGFQSVTFSRGDDPDPSGQLVDESQLKDRPCAPAKFVKHH
jgi:hypothetical protein